MIYLPKAIMLFVAIVVSLLCPLALARNTSVQAGPTEGFKCDYRIYGRPTVEDCAYTLNALPDAASPHPTLKLTESRYFIEPQFLEPPFKPQHNDYVGEMEQLPKFWRYREFDVKLFSAINRRNRG